MGIPLASTQFEHAQTLSRRKKMLPQAAVQVERRSACIKGSNPPVFFNPSLSVVLLSLEYFPFFFSLFFLFFVLLVSLQRVMLMSASAFDICSWPSFLTFHFNLKKKINLPSEAQKKICAGVRSYLERLVDRRTSNKRNRGEKKRKTTGKARELDLWNASVPPSESGWDCEVRPAPP